MKKIFAIVLFGAACMMLHAQDAVHFEFSDGMENAALKNKMEQQVSALLTAINLAETNHSVISYSGIDIDEHVTQSINKTWNAVHFRIVDDDIVEHCLRMKNSSGTIVGYQVRNIAIELKPLGIPYTGAQNQEVSIDFDLKGAVTGFNFIQELDLYVKIIREGERLDDLEQREQVMRWVELYRNAYTQKDIGFMEKIFNEDASIAKNEYSLMGKQQYLAYLRKTFSDNSYINVRFDDISVTRLASMPDCYGVFLRQDRSSSNKKEEGVVYFIWDFSNKVSPIIQFMLDSCGAYVSKTAYTDRTAFGLKGNVKKVIQNGDVDVIVYHFGTEWISCNLEFSQSGKLVRVNGLKSGNKLKDMEGEYFAADYEEFKKATKDMPEGVFVFSADPEFGLVRDANGRIIKRVHLVSGCEEDWEDWETLQYDDKGRVATIKMSVRNPYEKKFTDKGDYIKYFYDDNDNVIKAVWYDSDEKKSHTITYQYKKFDSAGNWLVRVANCEGRGPINEIEQRIVEY